MKFSLFFKVSMMLLALGVVIYSIEALKSSDVQQKASDPQSMISLLVGGDLRPLNWCPQPTLKIELLGANRQVLKTLTSSADISAVCELMIGGYSQDSAKPQFVEILKAYPAEGSGNPVSLERQAETSVFRVKGMPFSCPALVKILDRLAGL